MATKKASKQAASRELTKTQWKLKEIRQNWVAYLMVAPYMILFTLFTVVPVVLSIVISFTDSRTSVPPYFKISSSVASVSSSKS